MKNTDITVFERNSWENVAEFCKQTIQGWVMDAVEEVLNERIHDINPEDKRLNVEELCARWNISKGTLTNWEKEGRIKPLPLGGRKKIYSLKDVLDAELDEGFQTAC